MYSSITEFYILNNLLFKKNNICKYENLKLDTFPKYNQILKLS